MFDFALILIPALSFAAVAAVVSEVQHSLEPEPGREERGDPTAEPGVDHRAADGRAACCV